MICDICPLLHCNIHAELCIQSPEFKLALHREQQEDAKRFQYRYTGSGTWDRKARNEARRIKRETYAVRHNL